MTFSRLWLNRLAKSQTLQTVGQSDVLQALFETITKSQASANWRAKWRFSLSGWTHSKKVKVFDSINSGNSFQYSFFVIYWFFWNSKNRDVPIRYFQAASKSTLCIDIVQCNFSMKALLFEAFSQWKLLGLVLQWNMTTGFLRNLQSNLYAEGLCQCLMQEFVMRNPSPMKLHAHQSVGVQSHLHAPFPDDWTWPLPCNLLLDKHAPEIAQNKSIYTWPLISGKHSGVAISGYQYMRDSVANQSFASNLCIFCLHPTVYPSKLAFGEWRDGSWWFLIVPDHPDTTRGWYQGWIWITWSKGDSWSK